MSRTTISLPDDLKAEMDKAGGDANWSAVAADAFRSELTRIKARKATLKGNTMQATIQRLKASKEAYAKEGAERGRNAGATWASQNAEYGELKLLDDNWQQVESCETDDAFGAPGVFLGMIGMDVGRQDINEFWSNLGFEVNDPDQYSAEWWDGFVEGALEVFQEVEDKI